MSTPTPDRAAQVAQELVHKHFTQPFPNGGLDSLTAEIADALRAEREAERMKLIEWLEDLADRYRQNNALSQLLYAKAASLRSPRP